jgi:N-acetylglutamate synthase-like GNAT family acetyltransferase
LLIEDNGRYDFQPPGANRVSAAFLPAIVSSVRTLSGLSAVRPIAEIVRRSRYVGYVPISAMLDWHRSLNGGSNLVALRNMVGPMIDTSTHLIRAARPADADAVSALLAASYERLLAARYDSDALDRALPFMTKANPTLLTSGTYYVAETQPDNLVGCGGWTTGHPGSGEIIEGEAHIRHFATHPEWVRRGVGTSLLARCFSDARPFGVRKFHCFSTLNAERFYQALGFDTVGPIDVPMGPSLTFPGVLMSRVLA